MKKYNKQQIRELRKQGLTIRQIQKRIKASSPSVVHHHLTPKVYGDIDYKIEFLITKLRKEINSLKIYGVNKDYLLGVKHIQQWLLELLDEHSKPFLNKEGE